MEFKTYDVYYNKDNRNELWSHNVEATTEAQAIYFATMMPRDDTKGKMVPIPFIPQHWYAKIAEEDFQFIDDDMPVWHSYADSHFYTPVIYDDIFITKVRHNKVGHQHSIKFRREALTVFKLPYIEPSYSVGKSRIWFRNTPTRVSLKSNKFINFSKNTKEARWVFSKEEATDYDNRFVGWNFPLKFDKKYNLYYIDIADRHDKKEETK